MEARSNLITVMIVDDHPSSIAGLRAFLETTEEIRVVKSCNYPDEVMPALGELGGELPNIILLDLDYGKTCPTGFEVIPDIHEMYPEIRILLCSAFSDLPFILKALDVHVDGYIIKTRDSDEIIEAVRGVAVGNCVYSPEVRQVLGELSSGARERSASDRLHRLSPRELEVLELMAAKKSNPQIAAILCVAVATVKTHVTNILEKLELANREQARVYFLTRQQQR